MSFPEERRINSLRLKFSHNTGITWYANNRKHILSQNKQSVLSGFRERLLPIEARFSQ